MRRTTPSLCCLAALTMLVLTGCGGSDDDSTSTAGSPSPSASSQSPSAPPSASPSPSPAAEGCEPPKRDLEWTTGTASLDVTAGPDQGHYDLALDDGLTSGYAAGDQEVTGRFLSADEKAVLFIDIEGSDPCVPDAFTSIGTRGAGGPLFIDSSHTACTVELSALGEDGASGSFTCTGLVGGGEGLERDAEGTFTVAP
jgi:hypothetical protein